MTAPPIALCARHFEAEQDLATSEPMTRCADLAWRLVRARARPAISPIGARACDPMPPRRRGGSDAGT